jgi:hypothetical protein
MTDVSVSILPTTVSFYALGLTWQWSRLSAPRRASAAAAQHRTSRGGLHVMGRFQVAGPEPLKGHGIVVREPPNGGCADALSTPTRLRAVP